MLLIAHRQGRSAGTARRCRHIRRDKVDNTDHYDLLVVGGGINGAGIARDATGRGLKVLLCEQDDLAAHTSSASTKLIHGGLRYLEYYEFGLVRKALQEREVLLRAAPHIIRPLRFVMPHMPHLRPAWLIRAGLFLYDHLARREMLPGSESIDLRTHPCGTPLVDSITRGFVYSDGWVDDARLVVLNALDAQLRGATILTRTRLVSAQRNGSSWDAQLRSRDGRLQQVRARAIANAAGPWVGELLTDTLKLGAQHRVRLVKGSHIVTRKLFDHDFAYIFQNPDKRIIFAIPYQKDFTLIGTTDVEYHDDASRVQIDESEVAYLCESVNRYFKRSIARTDVVWTYAGVRPLLENDESATASAVTRDYRLDLDMPPGQAPILSVFGGKITTFRKLAEEALDRLSGPLAITQPAWTRDAPLPGGDIAGSNFAAFAEQFAARHRWLPDTLARRYAHAYGTRVERLLQSAKELSDLGTEIAPGLYEAELRYLRDEEWACSAEDVLWRRSKVGLRLDAQAVGNVQAWFERFGGDAHATAEPNLRLARAVHV
ncbi:homodimeric glycerol 3-phosphate dehydrogenase (quinone) [Burkholderia sp. b14]|nr:MULTISPECIES: glycerol-3-phosphate dehydrogenase [unclassified Mycetohabitans]MCF2134807.1 glycerol-3-phosphate dehydrogenase [Mycetohabitans sp. B3]MCG1040110.1 glycerol-3-phosphate dehydrogenase [Mycetohabitans sp. B7]SIT72862.1 homodimeric glycerol 3-phosphate dehydrogenase (quinone) [Burkholderia sp. b14]